MGGSVELEEKVIRPINFPCSVAAETHATILLHGGMDLGDCPFFSFSHEIGLKHNIVHT